jgi:hypothetical protein
MAPLLEGNPVVSTKKTVLKGELLIRRTKNQARDLGTVQLKDSICFQFSRNWFLGNWTLDPCLKWALECSEMFSSCGLGTLQPLGRAISE